MYSGLGAGIAATAFTRHGLDTTIVEIDPVVYDAATKYFGLPVPAPERLVLNDARTWVLEQKAALEESAASFDTSKAAPTPGKLFDIVVHDCFTGGSVPSHLFTQQFWYDLKNITDPNGIVAVVSSSNCLDSVHVAQFVCLFRTSQATSTGILPRRSLRRCAVSSLNAVRSTTASTPARRARSSRTG